MKKTLSLILAVVMLLGCMSMTAFAETEPNYFCITNISEEAATVTWEQEGTPDALNLHYSFDKSAWTKITTLTANGATATISLAAGQSVYFKNDTGKFGNSSNGSSYCVNCDKVFTVSGDITTLLNGTGNVTDLTSAGPGVFQDLFREAQNLTSAKDLILPSTTLTNYCYSGMFYRCQELTTAPELPATTLVKFCYTNMFCECYNLNELHVSFTKWGSEKKGDSDYSATMSFLPNGNSTSSTLHFYCPAELDITNDGNTGLYNLIRKKKVTFHNTDNYTVIRGNITAYDVAYEMIIPTATSLGEDSHENVLLGKDGIVSVNITKHPSDKVIIYYYADLDKGTLTDGEGNTIDTSYAYKQGDDGFAELGNWDTEVTVYTGGAVVPSYVSVTANDEQWNDAPAGTYTASISFDFYCESAED